MPKKKTFSIFIFKDLFLLVLISLLILSTFGCKKKEPVSPPEDTSSVELNIGDSYKGGIVAYLDSTKKHGLIAATNDQSSPLGDQVMEIIWHVTRDTTIINKGIAIGTGQANTAAIVATYGDEINAAKICADLVEQKYGGWYLPSKDELNELYLNKDAIGGFEDFFYWSSSDDEKGSVWSQDFIDGFQTSAPKNYMLHVRAVRSF